MADNKNVELNDEMMAKASGGTVDVEPYGFVCEATVVSGPGTATVNGVPRTEYSVSEPITGKSISQDGSIQMLFLRQETEFSLFTIRTEASVLNLYLMRGDSLYEL